MKKFILFLVFRRLAEREIRLLAHRDSAKARWRRNAGLWRLRAAIERELAPIREAREALYDSHRLGWAQNGGEL